MIGTPLLRGPSNSGGVEGSALRPPVGGRPSTDDFILALPPCSCALPGGKVPSVTLITEGTPMSLITFASTCGTPGGGKGCASFGGAGISLFDVCRRVACVRELRGPAPRRRCIA